ncbi:MAG: hypothetical protein GC145_02070 [Caulobacter sp.]|nr:hypothetical protein [Caulobacter sp.]
MVKVNYPGVSHGEARRKLDDIEQALMTWRQRCRPFGPQYLAIDRIQDAVRQGREILTGDQPRIAGDARTGQGLDLTSNETGT